VAYSYLVANPVIWFVGLIGVLLSTVLVLGKWIFGFEIQEKRTFILLNIFWFSWVGYMLAVLKIDRVMYLYHYFPPLIISFVLAILCFQILSKNQIIKERLEYFGFFISILVFATFLFYSPFTYSISIDCEGFRSRNAFEFWQMKSVNKIDGKDCPLYQKN
jgi:dolichyl-phosphate-mannose--protein O-mannosyl transferase